jgi:hypothetical protein
VSIVGEEIVSVAMFRGGALATSAEVDIYDAINPLLKVVCVLLLR